jgi:hypothetical protein
MLHHTRHLFVRQQTSVINAIRAHLSEFGITAGGLPSVCNDASNRGVNGWDNKASYNPHAIRTGPRS